MENDIVSAINRLKQGKPPGNGAVIREITVGIQDLIHFLEKNYLEEYIKLGGSKIKFLTGKKGSGKSHFLGYLADTAKNLGFITVYLSAKSVWLHDFKDIYFEIYNKCDLEACLKKCADKIIGDMGYDCQAIPDGVSFTDYLSSTGDLDAITKKEIRNQLQQMFLKNPLIDNNFAVVCSFLTGEILGHPQLDDSNRDMLKLWLAGSKEIKLTAIRKLGLSTARITKYNARHMLRSLIEIHCLAGYPGFWVAVDDMDILVNPDITDTIRYTKMKREDAYENIREMIDEIDSLKNIMFVLSFDNILIDDAFNGLKSYQALWLRIQNEIVSERFNNFTDIIDLNAYGNQIYTEETLMEMSRLLADLFNRNYQGAEAINRECASEIRLNAIHSNTAPPGQTGYFTLNKHQPELGANDLFVSETERSADGIW